MRSTICFMKGHGSILDLVSQTDWHGIKFFSVNVSRRLQFGIQDVEKGLEADFSSVSRCQSKQQRANSGNVNFGVIVLRWKFDPDEID